MAHKVFVDGQEGTTGLKIHERLAGRTDIELLKIPADKRKDLETRKAFINDADIVFLCLPDAASREAVTLIENDRTRVLDASTAFRTDPSWAYGIPELSDEHRNKIKTAPRVAVPGCHATGLITALYPLVKNNIVPDDFAVTCHSVSGYSGGGKKLIASYENPDSEANKPVAPRHYALGLKHKHIPEMQKITGLKYPPLFTPIVSNFYNGMSVSVGLTSRLLPGNPSAKDIHAFLTSYYASQHFIKVIPFESDSHLDEGFLNPMACNETNNLEMFVFGHDEQILIISRFDNLGKGASGAAVQNMNIMLGVDESTGLESVGS